MLSILLRVRWRGGVSQVLTSVDSGEFELFALLLEAFAGAAVRLGNRYSSPVAWLTRSIVLTPTTIASRLIVSAPRIANAIPMG